MMDRPSRKMMAYIRDRTINNKLESMSPKERLEFDIANKDKSMKQILDDLAGPLLSGNYLT